MEKVTHDDILNRLQPPEKEEEGKENQLPDQELLDDVTNLLAYEQVAYKAHMNDECTISALHKTQQKLSLALQKVGASGDLETILSAENLILDNEREHYADDDLMRSSIDNAINEIVAALMLVDEIQDPDSYKAVTDIYFRSHKNRIKGLPNDSARLFFRSHRARLENHQKSRLMGLDKELIGVRKANLAKASASYIQLQETALSGPEPAPEVNRNTENRR